MYALRQNLVAVLALALGACATAPTARPGDSAELEISANEYGRFFQAAVLTLREAGFQIDRHDYRFGRISTQPLPQATALEPWRSSGTRAEDALGSTMNFRRLVVTVALEPLGQGKADASAGGTGPSGAATLPPPSYTLRVQVDIEQLQRPDSYVTGSSRVISRYGRAPAELAERGVPTAYWEPIGHDEKMAQELLQEILRRSTQLPDEPAADSRAPSGTS